MSKKLPLPILQSSIKQYIEEDEIEEIDIDPEDYIILNEVLNNIKNLPLKIKDINLQIINLLNEKKELLDDNLKIHVEQYIDFLSKQTYLNN